MTEQQQPAHTHERFTAQPERIQGSLTVPEKSVEFDAFGSGEKIRLTVAMVRDFLAARTKSGAIPSDAEIVKFMMLCKSRQLNPWEGDAFLIGYDGQNGPTFSLVTAHQAFLKRAEVHPEFDGMKSGVIVQNPDGSVVDLEGDFHLDSQTLLGGWATVYFTKRKHPKTARLRLGTFRKNTSIWGANPNGMICKCAEADALRSSFPTMLGGLMMREEIIESPPPASPPLGKSALNGLAAHAPEASPAAPEADTRPADEPPVQAGPPPLTPAETLSRNLFDDFSTRIGECVDPSDLGDLEAEIATASLSSHHRGRLRDAVAGKGKTMAGTVRRGRVASI